MDLSRSLRCARTRTDALFDLVKPDAFYDRPIPERHRIIFYLGHLEAFDWNLLDGGTLDGTLDRLFAFGIDPKAGDLPDDVPSDWPRIVHVLEYNRRIRERLDGAIESAPEQLLHVAIEHRLMHAETFAYMLHQQPYDRKFREDSPPAASGPAPENPLVEIPTGAAMLGRPRGEGFGWDNEFDAHTVAVDAFAMSKYKITNGEYLEFVKDGGPVPPFWICRDGRWLYRGMFHEVPLPLDWPVYATLDQARAYADWRGRSLATEAQFQRAAYGSAPRGNFDFRAWDPVPVPRGPENAFGIAEMVGNGWEWTNTPFAPFEGFEPFSFYPGYSANFFDGEHFVLKGASPRTAACFTRSSFRNWFRPGYPYVYAGFRLVES